jgi:phosphatidylserine decarboxylase
VAAANLETDSARRQSPESAEVLGHHQAGWFGEVGHKDLMEVANAANQTSFRFEDMYKCQPAEKHFGFKSWDGRSTTSLTVGMARGSVC